jgi:hypothetical protein
MQMDYLIMMKISYGLLHLNTKKHKVHFEPYAFLSKYMAIFDTMI